MLSNFFYNVWFLPFVRNSWAASISGESLLSLDQVMVPTSVGYILSLLKISKDNPIWSLVWFLGICHSVLTLVHVLYSFFYYIYGMIWKTFYHDVVGVVRSFWEEGNDPKVNNPYWAEYVKVFSKRRVSWFVLMQLAGQVSWNFLLPRIFNLKVPRGIEWSSFNWYWVTNFLFINLGLAFGYLSFRVLLYGNYHLIVKEEENVRKNSKLLQRENFTELFLQSGARLATCSFIWNIFTRHLPMCLTTLYWFTLVSLRSNSLVSMEFLVKHLQDPNLDFLQPWLEVGNIFSFLNLGVRVMTMALFADYVLSWSVISKTADVIGDQVESKNLTKLDKLGDIMADATFTPLVLNVLGYQVSEWIVGPWINIFGPLIQISRYLSFTRLLDWLGHRFNFIKSLTNDSIDYLVLFTLWFLGPVPTLILKVALSLTDLKFMSLISNLVNFDSGFLAFLPMMLIPVVELATLLGVEHRHVLSLIPLLAVFDQVGYLFDKFDQEEQDMFGNQVKATFKWLILWSNKLNYISYLWVSYQGFKFYSHLESFNQAIKSGKLDKEKVSAAELNYLDSSRYDLASTFLRMISIKGNVVTSPATWLVLSGGTLDNLKKAYELKKLNGEKDTLSKVQNMDLLGDFLKDVLYPAVLAFSSMELMIISKLIDVQVKLLSLIVTRYS